MQISKEEIIHIAKLANLNLSEQEIEKTLINMQDILNFANTVNKVDTTGIDETIGATANYNVFRKDEIKVFEDKDALLQNAPEKEDNMFKIPKVI